MPDAPDSPGAPDWLRQAEAAIDADVPRAIERAEAGDAEAGEWLTVLLCIKLDAGRSLSRELGKYLARRLREVLGYPADELPTSFQGTEGGSLERFLLGHYVPSPPREPAAYRRALRLPAPSGRPANPALVEYVKDMELMVSYMAEHRRARGEPRRRGDEPPSDVALKRTAKKRGVCVDRVKTARANVNKHLRRAT